MLRLTRGRPPVDTHELHGAAAAEPHSVGQHREQMHWLPRWRRRRSRQCTECGATLIPCFVESCSGVDGSSSVTLTRVPVLGCQRSDHPRRWAHPEFGMLFIDQIYNEGSFPVARRGIRGLSCRRCDASLSPITLTPGQIHGVATVADLQPFEVSICAGVLTCATCKLEQADSRRSSEAELSEAFANAFRDGGLNP